jgi:hypothetical protein
MGKAKPPFIEKFNNVMRAIASPAYLLMPLLEKLFPRPAVHVEISAFKAAFDKLIHERRRNKGEDLISLMLEDEKLSHDEVRENLITFFIASHVRTKAYLLLSFQANFLNRIPPPALSLASCTISLSTHLIKPASAPKSSRSLDPRATQPWPT